MKRSSDRLDFMRRQLQGLHLHFEIVQAVDGALLTNGELQKYSRRLAMKRVGRELGRGEIGAALSHGNVWRRIVEEGVDRVLVLEDDVFVGTVMTHMLEHDNWPRDWELINFWSRSRQIPFGAPVYDIYRATRFVDPPYSACCYLINGKGARKLLDHLYPIRQPADHLTASTDLTKLVVYGVDPGVVSLSPDLPSTIVDRSESDGLALSSMGRLKRMARRAAGAVGLRRRARRKY